MACTLLGGAVKGQSSHGIIKAIILFILLTALEASTLLSLRLYALGACLAVEAVAPLCASACTILLLQESATTASFRLYLSPRAILGSPSPGFR